MSWNKTHDLCVKVGKYTDKRSGEEKYRFAKVGKVLAGNRGQEVMILDRHFSPAGTLYEGMEGVTLYKFVDTKSPTSKYPDPPPGIPDDDRPF